MTKIVGSGDQVVCAFHFLEHRSIFVSPPLKIGSTRRLVEDRINDSKSVMFSEPFIDLMIFCKDALSLEKSLHARLAEFRSNSFGREWFDVDVADILKAYNQINNDCSIGEKVRFRRSYLGMSQTDLAEISGVRVATISEIETGKANTTLRTLSKILSELDLKISVSDV